MILLYLCWSNYVSENQVLFSQFHSYNPSKGEIIFRKKNVSPLQLGHSAFQSGPKSPFHRVFTSKPNADYLSLDSLGLSFSLREQDQMQGSCGNRSLDNVREIYKGEEMRNINNVKMIHL